MSNTEITGTVNVDLSFTTLKSSITTNNLKKILLFFICGTIIRYMLLTSGLLLASGFTPTSGSNPVYPSPPNPQYNTILTYYDNNSNSGSEYFSTNPFEDL